MQIGNNRNIAKALEFCKKENPIFYKQDGYTTLHLPRIRSIGDEDKKGYLNGRVLIFS